MKNITTAIGNPQATSVEGRTENPQKTIPFFLHRDNINILESIKGETHDFLRLLPDFTGFKYSGQVSYMANNTDVGSLEQGQITITPTSSDEYVENCYGLVEDTVVFKNAIDEVITLSGTGTKELTLDPEPTDATLTVTSGSTAVATAAIANKKLTITAVAAGNTIVKITGAKSGYASFVRTILVIVE